MTYTPATTESTGIGIEASDRKEIADGLSRLLADSYTLYLKTQNFHWNVTGPMFATLHAMFELQYAELALAVDLVAERIRALDHPARAATRSSPRSPRSINPPACRGRRP
jgi:starvation-inducible DNA-binding protein